MPLDDFHRQGRPRNGQWVWVTVGKEKMLAVCEGRDHGCFRTRQNPASLGGEIEIIGFPTPSAIAENVKRLRAGSLSAVKPLRDHFAVAVLVLGGRDTAFHVLVHGDRLTPVVDRTEFPAAVLKTMHPDFRPTP